MRIGVAQVVQETCSFTPLRTTIEKFAESGLHEGQDVIDGLGSTSALAGFLSAVGERASHSVTVPCWMRPRWQAAH